MEHTKYIPTVSRSSINKEKAHVTGKDTESLINWALVPYGNQIKTNIIRAQSQILKSSVYNFKPNTCLNSKMFKLGYLVSQNEGNIIGNINKNKLVRYYNDNFNNRDINTIGRPTRCNFRIRDLCKVKDDRCFESELIYRVKALTTQVIMCTWDARR